VIVERYVTHDRVEPARVLFREGDPGDTLYLLTRGAVEISIAVEPDRRHRIVTMSAGALFGEAALLDGRPRSATAVAVEASAFYALTGTALDELVKSHPGIATTLLRNLARDVSRRMRETDQVLRALDDSQG
jgi:CRP-like cAMP-binding protein